MGFFIICNQILKGYSNSINPFGSGRRCTDTQLFSEGSWQFRIRTSTKLKKLAFRFSYVLQLIPTWICFNEKLIHSKPAILILMEDFITTKWILLLQDGRRQVGFSRKHNFGSKERYDIFSSRPTGTIPFTKNTQPVAFE